MVATVRLTKVGAPEVMQLHEEPDVAPGPGEVWIEQRAIGVNFLDVMQRNGASKIQLPSGLGFEGAGLVQAVGPGVDSVKVGDRVAYITRQRGAYASARIVPAERLVRLPDTVSFQDAAAILFKGITAQYLLKSTYPVGPATTMVLYGVAGGLGSIMTKWAKHLGAFVIGVVSKEQRVEKAKRLGCDEVLVFNAKTLAADVARITDGKKADVVYDPIGRISFTASLDSLRPRGLMVSFGSASGLPAPVKIDTLRDKGSLYLTRPTILDHTSNAEEYQERALDVLDALLTGIIDADIWKTYDLRDVAQAHSDMENGRSSGLIVLEP